jgi:hypothetical protein
MEYGAKPMLSSRAFFVKNDGRWRAVAYQQTRSSINSPLYVGALSAALVGALALALASVVGPHL